MEKCEYDEWFMTLQNVDLFLDFITSMASFMMEKTMNESETQV